MNLILYSISITLLYGLNIFFYIPYYGEEQTYVDAARKTWKNQPIQFISTIQINGYKKYYFFDQEDIDTFCDCTFIRNYEKPSSGECKPMQKKDGCIEYTKNKAYNYYDLNLFVSFFLQII